MLKGDLAKLHAENLRLATELRAKSAEVESLKTQLNSRAHEDLAEEESAVLLALARHPPNEEVQERVIAQMAGVGVQVAAYHLENLRGKKLAEAHHYVGLPSQGIYAETQWTLAHQGRGYLIKRGLLR